MNNEYSPSASFGDLLEEDNNEFVQESVNVKMGVAQSFKLPDQRQSTFKPNATRYVFNPFEIIDLRNLGATCGIHYIENIVFNKIVSIPTTIRKADYLDIASGPLPGQANHNDENYQRFDRTSYMIARELEEHYGDKGVTEISALLDATEEDAADLAVLLFGEEVTFISDPNNPDRPCPPLRELLETLHANVTVKTKGMDEETRVLTLKAAKQIRESIGLAIKYARDRTENAHARFLDPKNPNKMFSDAEQRCFLALGEEIPNTMPLISKNAFNSQMNPNAGIGAEVVGALAAAGIIGNQVVAQAPVAPIGEPEKALAAIDFNVDEGDVEAAEAAVPIKVGDTVLYNGQEAQVHANRFGKLHLLYADGSTDAVTKDQVTLK